MNVLKIHVLSLSIVYVYALSTTCDCKSSNVAGFLAMRLRFRMIQQHVFDVFT